MDKFRAVRKLKLFISGQPEFYDLIEKLLGKVSRSLEELEVSFGSRPPPEFMEPGEDLPRLAGLRKLRIETMPISERGTSTRMFDAGSRPCYELLAFADEMDNLEEFKLDILEVRSTCECYIPDLEAFLCRAGR